MQFIKRQFIMPLYGPNQSADSGTLVALPLVKAMLSCKKLQNEYFSL